MIAVIFHVPCWGTAPLHTDLRGLFAQHCHSLQNAMYFFYSEYKASLIRWGGNCDITDPPIHHIQSENVLNSLNKMQGFVWMATVHRTQKIRAITVVAPTTTVIISFHRSPSSMKYAYLHRPKLDQCIYATRIIPGVQLEVLILSYCTVL